MAETSGHKAKFVFGTTTLEAKSIALTNGVDTIDVSKTGVDYKRFISALKGYSLRVETDYDDAVTPLVEGAFDDWAFYPDRDATKYWHNTAADTDSGAYVTRVAPSVSASGGCTISYEFQITGDVEWATSS